MMISGRGVKERCERQGRWCKVGARRAEESNLVETWGGVKGRCGEV